MLSERMRRWKKNLSTRKFPEYVLTLRSDINRFADDIDRLADMAQSLESENIKLHQLVTAVLVLRNDPSYEWLDAAVEEVYGKSFTDVARELGIEVNNG